MDSDLFDFELEDDNDSNENQSTIADERSETGTVLSATTKQSVTNSMVSELRETKTVITESNMGEDETTKQYNRNSVLRQLYGMWNACVTK